MKLVTLKKRRDFVLSNKHGQKTHNKNFILQEYCNPNISDQGLMFGFTATKRIGNAVKRNRAKRRMRALISGLLKEDKILFKNPSNFSKPVAKIKEGRLLLVQKCDGEWCKVKTEKIKGWVKKDNVWGLIN